MSDKTRTPELTAALLEVYEAAVLEILEEIEVDEHQGAVAYHIALAAMMKATKLTEAHGEGG